MGLQTPANNVTSDASTSRAATKIPVLICPSDQFESNPFELPGGPAAIPPQTSPGAVGGMYSGTSYAGNYGEGAYFVRFSTFPINPDGVLFMTGNDDQLRPSVMPAQQTALGCVKTYSDLGSTLHASCCTHFNLPAVKAQTITDGTSHTIMMGEKYHFDDFFDSWTSGNSGMKMHQVSAWAWTGGMKGSAHLFCSSIVDINNLMRAYTTSINVVQDQDRRYNGWGSGHPGVCCFVFANGSTRVLSQTVNHSVLKAISTRASDEVVDNFE